MKRSLIYYDNPILRQRAKEIPKITEEIRSLAQDMVETMDAHRGVGLAANQVGVLLRIFVIRPEIENERGEIGLGDPLFYINPKLANPSREKELFTEGCLSVPGLHIDIPRPSAIDIEAIDLEGNPIFERVEGFKARQIMHEKDHLDEFFFFDRLRDKKKRKEIETPLRVIKKKWKA